MASAEILPCFVCASGTERPKGCQDVFGKEGLQANAQGGFADGLLRRVWHARADMCTCSQDM